MKGLKLPCFEEIYCKESSFFGAPHKYEVRQQGYRTNWQNPNWRKIKKGQIGEKNFANLSLIYGSSYAVRGNNSYQVPQLELASTAGHHRWFRGNNSYQVPQLEPASTAGRHRRFEGAIHIKSHNWIRQVHYSASFLIIS